MSLKTTCGHIDLFTKYGGSYAPVSCPYCAHNFETTRLLDLVASLTEKLAAAEAAALSLVSFATAPPFVDASHLPTVIDVLETEVASLTAERDAAVAETKRITEVELDFRDRLITTVANDFRSQLAALQPLVTAAKAWRKFLPDDYMGECEVPQDLACEALVDAIDALDGGK